MTDQPSALATADRLWQLVVTLETLLRSEKGDYRGPPLDPTVASLYGEAVSIGVEAGLLTAADGQALREVLESWPSQPPLIRELTAAIVTDLNALRSSPEALAKAARIIHGFRSGTRTQA